MRFTALMLKIFQKCAGNSGCEVCRLQMEEDCLFFPELYRLHDMAEASGTPLRELDLRPLADLCTLCGICPCQDIRVLLIRAKAALAREQEVPLSARILSDVQRIGRWGTALSVIANPLNRLKRVQSAVHRALDISVERQLPVFPTESFFRWADKKGLRSGHRVPEAGMPKVAYFAGCSAGYLFPGVGRAVVRILEENRIPVFVPPQDCCGMPLIMEGNQEAALKKIRSNLESLHGCIADGYDIVCSCPTCGYFFRRMLPEYAWYSDAFQKRSGTDGRDMKVPFGPGSALFLSVPSRTYQAILKDEGYFSGLDPLMRIDISRKIRDMGEYLLGLQAQGRLKAGLRFPERSFVYFAPCHQREQGIGAPYADLFRFFLKADLRQAGEVMQCCGMGGHLGYKAGFHAHSLAIGRPLFDRLSEDPGSILITDCLSCRLQFRHALSREVFHPLEMLRPA